ncbi:hypothetical protein B0A55_02577 [Friedmanniomyces simplex]|uniref:O-methyltransferase dimerisation domain-containing protein n=1 Tax=Friedmanniomyces simplex TaxID=329884 RepID=A0A4U0XJB8_9PEZI|nr:hypothetical protein B0A55_02577 [Friedmanniomyces simplex]
MVQLGVELDLFKAVDDEPERRWTVADLANLIGADATLLFLRYLFTLGVVRENPDATYSATDATRWLATDAAESDVKQNKAANRAMF